MLRKLLKSLGMFCGLRLYLNRVEVSHRRAQICDALKGKTDARAVLCKSGAVD